MRKARKKWRAVYICTPRLAPNRRIDFGRRETASRARAIDRDSMLFFRRRTSRESSVGVEPRSRGEFIPAGDSFGWKTFGREGNARNWRKEPRKKKTTRVRATPGEIACAPSGESSRNAVVTPD